MMMTKLRIYITLICFMGYFKDSWQRHYCPANGTYLLGVDQQQVEYAGNESCIWKVQESVLENYAVFLLIDNTTLSTPENSCIGQLLLPGDQENGTCENMVRTCFVYYKGNICNQNELSEKITKQKFDCNDVSFHSVVNTIQLQYHLINTSINHEFPAFRMIYKPIKCNDVRNEVTASFGRNFKIGRGNSGKNDQDIPINSEEPPMSTEKTAITIVAATVGCITILLIALTIIKREKAHRRDANTIELKNIAKDGTAREDELYSPNSSFRKSEETQEIEYLNGANGVKESPYYQV